MSEWMKEHGVDTILGVVGLTGLAGVTKFSKEVAEMWRDHPWPIAFCCLLAFTLGTWFCYSRGRGQAYVERKREERARAYAKADEEEARRHSERKAEERRRSAEEDAARVKAEEARKLVLRLKPWLKKFLHKVHEKGGSVETEIVSDRTVFNELYPVNELFEMTRVSGHGDEHVWRLTLNEYGRYVVEECFDLLEEATEHEAANDG